MDPAVHWRGTKRNQTICGSVIGKKRMKSWSKIHPCCTTLPKSMPITRVVIPKPTRTAPRIYF
ncbi:MAG TPA: hypothetical protein DD662_10855, partial [Planctomycetaceae bacterium]|nr:hypothetical protein [Planctomycetaceae bacterium]